MQLSSRGQPPVRGELHTGDAGLQPGERSGTLWSLVVDGLDDNSDALVLAEIEIGRRLEDPMRKDGFGESRHLNTCSKNTPTGAVPVFVPVCGVPSVI
jgi:hypothetical protein